MEHFFLFGLHIVDTTAYNSLGYILVALGVLISIRFMGFPDLTIDGSFTLGAGGYAVAIKAGSPLPVAWLFAITLGGGAGLATSFINQHLKVGKIISSILVMIAAITLTPYITGNSTVGLLDSSPLLNSIISLDLTIKDLWSIPSYPLHPHFTLFFSCVCFLCLLTSAKFFKSNLGIKMRYTGGAPLPGLVEKTKQKRYTHLGLFLGNSFAAFGGAVEAERNGGFSANMGLGTLLIGLTILVLGESILKTRLKRDFLNVRESYIAIVIGVLVYSFGIQVLLEIGVTFVDIRLMTTVFLLLTLSFASHFHPNSAKLF